MTTTSDNRPTEISAETFYREYYAERINLGECDVWWDEDHSKVSYLRKMNVSPQLYEVYFVGEAGTFANVYPEREFTVTWLTTPAPSVPPAPAAEAVEAIDALYESLSEIWRLADSDVGGADEINDADSYIELLRGKLSSMRMEVITSQIMLTQIHKERDELRQQLAASEERGRGLRETLAFYADDKIYKEYSNSYSMEPENFVDYIPVLEDGGKRASAALATGGGERGK